MNLTVPEFGNAVTAWANENSDRIKTLWPLKGGWEEWAQAEIASYINQNAPASYIDREVYVYQGMERADFLINDPLQNPAGKLIIVEMKCESFNNWTNFVDGLKKDAWKLNGDLKGGLQAAQKLVFGIFFSPESQEKLADLAGFTLTYTANNEIGFASLTM